MRGDGTVVVVKGDEITVQALGFTVTGKVISADWWGKEDGWYIEIGNTNLPCGYSYWKQGIDGGKIVKLNGKDVVYE